MFTATPTGSDLQFIREVVAFTGLRQLRAVLKGARGNRVTLLLSQAFGFKELF